MGQLLDFLVGAAVIAAPISTPARYALALGSAGVKAVQAHKEHKAPIASAAGASSSSSSPAVDLVFSDLRVTVESKDGGEAKEILGGVSGVAKAGR